MSVDLTIVPQEAIRRGHRICESTGRPSSLKKAPINRSFFFAWFWIDQELPTTARSKIATILMIFIIGLTAGPAVSLYGSPTVSPVTDAA